jgi:hypothetical protein
MSADQGYLRNWAPGSDYGAANMTFPTDDYFVIGGDRSPGKATLIKCNSPSGIDVRKGYGLDGASTVPTGQEPSDIEFLIELWDETTHPAAFDIFARKWLTRPVAIPQGGLKALALNIQHTGVNRAPFNVSKVLRHDVVHHGDPEGIGLWSYTVTFLQFRLPKAAPSRPLAAIPKAKNPRPTAKDANEVQIQQLNGTLTSELGE